MYGKLKKKYKYLMKIIIIIIDIIIIGQTCWVWQDQGKDQQILCIPEKDKTNRDNNS